MKKVLIAFGTRPEIIKLAPVILELKEHCELRTLHSGQHTDLADPLFSLFGFNPDLKLDIMKPGQDLFYLTQELLPLLKDILVQEKPDYVIVQGDTTTSYLTALASFYLQIPILHVEAGLRTHNPYFPFPEEMNRTQISHLASFHFAPTPLNKRNLINEGIPEEHILVTGNTVIDAINIIKETEEFSKATPTVLANITEGDQLAVLTAHRRENHGKPLIDILKAAKQLLDAQSKLKIIFPAHPNPKVQAAIKEANIQNKRFITVEPIDYLPFLHVLQRADLILTDSGGIQEEASALGKPVLVLRNETERQELLNGGLGKLVGSNVTNIVAEALALLKAKKAPKPSVLFGDGKAAIKIREVITDQL